MRHWILCVALLSLAASPALAGGIGPMVSFWSTDEADDDTGLGVKLELDMGAVWDAELRVTLFEELAFPEQTPVYDLEATTIDVGIAYNFSKTERVNPYLGGGLSYANLDATTTVPLAQNPARLSDELGFYAVAGVELAVGRNLDVFAEALYRQLEAEIENDDLGGPVNVGFDLTGPVVNLGLLLSW